jgi:dTDP-4-dehydrorhamnose 3,5-epimerase
MQRLPTSLPELVLLELAVLSDERGRFLETYQQERYAAAGIAPAAPFVQDNLSTSVVGALRGLHYQLAQPQGKLVWVTRGAIFDVAVDIRRGSPRFGQWFGTTLSAQNHRQLWIPPGFAHGFAVTAADGGAADVAYKVTALYAPGDQHAIRWDDPELAIAWPLTGAPLLSPRDAAAPALRQAALPAYAP